MLNGIYDFFFEADDENQGVDCFSAPPVIFSSYNGAYVSQWQHEHSAIQRLSSKDWLQDLEIYEFLSYVASQSDPHKIYVLHPGFFTDERFEAFLQEIAIPGGVRSNYRTRLLDANLILCPIMIDKHWYLMAISKSPQDNQINIRCLDGYNRFEKHGPLLEAGKRMIEKLYHTNAFEFDFGSAKVVTQDNGYDCGTVICYYGARFCSNEFGQCVNLKTKDPYFEFRKVMIDVLLNLPSWKNLVDASSSHFEGYPESHLKRTPTPTRVCG